MDNFKNHPINIISVFPTCLSIKANIEPDPLVGVEITYSLQTAHSEYDRENKIISVKVKFEIEDAKGDEEKPPFVMLVDLMARFEVDESRFPIAHIDDWAARNAPIIVYPYLRERVYALTIQAGFKPLLLPLVEVPTFKIEKKISPTEEGKSS